jgi:hypothetical protein
LGSIETFSRFQKQVPITEYDDIASYIEAARHGQPAQLTRARPVFYAMTSGTTGPAKYIPVTEASRHAKARLMRLWLSGLFRDHPTIPDGIVLQPASPEVEAYAPNGTPLEEAIADDAGPRRPSLADQRRARWPARPAGGQPAVDRHAGRNGDPRSEPRGSVRLVLRSVRHLRWPSEDYRRHLEDHRHAFGFLSPGDRVTGWITGLGRQEWDVRP